MRNTNMDKDSILFGILIGVVFTFGLLSIAALLGADITFCNL